MPSSPHAEFDQTVLEMIEHSPSGAVPHTPTYDDAVVRLHAAQQIYTSADFPEGYVTARSLAQRPRFQAQNLAAYIEAAPGTVALESNQAIFERYLQTLPAAARTRAEDFRLRVAGRPIHHRSKGGQPVAGDPLHTIFLVPGAGPRPGLPGNYLYGALEEKTDAPADARWCIQILDTDNNAAVCAAASLAEAHGRLQEMWECVPFHLTELESLGFTLH